MLDEAVKQHGRNAYKKIAAAVGSRTVEQVKTRLRQDKRGQQVTANQFAEQQSGQTCIDEPFLMAEKLLLKDAIEQLLRHPRVLSDALYDEKSRYDTQNGQCKYLSLRSVRTFQLMHGLDAGMQGVRSMTDVRSMTGLSLGEVSNNLVKVTEWLTRHCCMPSATPFLDRALTIRKQVTSAPAESPVCHHLLVHGC